MARARVDVRSAVPKGTTQSDARAVKEKEERSGGRKDKPQSRSQAAPLIAPTLHKQLLISGEVVSKDTDGTPNRAGRGDPLRNPAGIEPLRRHRPRVQ